MSLSNGWPVERKAVEEYVAHNNVNRLLSPMVYLLRFEEDFAERLKYDFYSDVYYAAKSVWINKRGCTFCAMACFKYDLDTKQVEFWFN